MRKEVDDAALAALAARQHGTFSRDQAVKLRVGRGAISGRLQKGLWVELFPSVYRLAGVPVSWKMKLMGAVLWAGEGAVASHRAAGQLWGFSHFKADALELSLSGGLRAADRYHVIAHEKQTLDKQDVTVRDGIRVTRPLRTILDIAAKVAKGPLPQEALQTTIDEAVRRGWATERSLLKTLDRLGGRGVPGTKVLRHVLEKRKGTFLPLDSRYERQLLDIIVQGGLPVPTTQHPLKEGAREVYRVDMTYEAQKVAIEMDAFTTHDTEVAWGKDTTKWNELTEEGWLILRFVPDDLRKPKKVVARIRRTLAARPIR